MIIHNPIVSGSLKFPSDENGNLITLQVVNGTLETLTLNSSGVNQNVQPAVNYSGSFTGSFTGDGSGLSGLTSANNNTITLTAGAGLDGGGSITLNQSSDETITFTVSDGVVSGSSQVSYTGLSNIPAGIVSGSSQVSLETLTGGSGIQSGSITNDDLAGSIANGKLANSAITISGTSVSLGSSITDETLFGGVGVVTGSAQISHDSTTGFVANEHIDHSSVSITAGTGLNGGGTIASTRTLNVDSDYKNDSLNAFTASNANTSLNAATSSYLTSVDISSDTNLAVSDTDEVNMILSGDTLSAELIGGVVSGSAQISIGSTTGTLAVNKGGTGATTAAGARSNLGVDAAGTDNSTDVTLSGTPDYITISGQVITRNTIDIGDDTNLTAGTGITLTGDTLSTTDSEIVHDSLSGFVANEHIDHSSITIGSGKGLTGGGTIVTSRSLTLDTGSAHFDGGVSNKLTSLNTFSASLSTNLADLTDDEVAQLENIGSTTISSTQWGYLGALNQGLTQTSNVNFGDLTLSGDLTVNGETSYISSSVVQIGDNIIELNGTGGANGGIYVRDAVSTTNTGSFIWDTTNDYWKAGAKGSENEILTVGNVDSDIKTFSVPASTTISSFGKTLVDDADAATARTTLGVDAAGTDNSTNVTLSGTPNYITISGQVITRNTIDIGDDTNLAVSDTTNVDMILSGDTLSANLKGGVVSGSGQIDHDSTTGFVANEHINHGSVSITAGTGLNGGGTIASTRTLNVDSDYKNDSLNTFTSSFSSFGLSLIDDANASTARSTLGVDAAGTDNSTDVSLAGSYDYITISGQTITRGQIDLTTDVTGVLPSANLDSDTAHLSGTQTFSGAKSFSSAVNIDATTQSTSKTTGALIVDGGVGIAKTLNVGEDVVAYASSDERYKDNVTPIENPNDKIKQIGGYTFDWNDKHEIFKGQHDVGVIAQEIEKVLPEIVETRENGFKAVKYEKIVALLIESNKELIKRIEELESKIS
jgi:hypothetical protein